MLDDIRAQPHQIGDALWRVDAADVPRADMAGGLVVCGMGGSAIGGDLAAAAIGPRALAPLRTVRGYTLDPWIGDQHLVLCASYSGGTEETLSCFEAAGAAGRPARGADHRRRAGRARARAGGSGHRRAVRAPAPGRGHLHDGRRAAVRRGLWRGALAAGRAGGGGCAAGGAGRRRRARPRSPRRWTARSRWSTAPSSRPPRPGAGRARSTRTPTWPRSPASCPRPTTTRSRAGRTRASTGPFSAVFLGSPGLHPRVQRRIELYSEVLEAEGAPVVHVRSRGDTPVAEVLSLVMLGDLASVALAELGGVDPAAMEAIEAIQGAALSSAAVRPCGLGERLGWVGAVRSARDAPVTGSEGLRGRCGELVPNSALTSAPAVNSRTRLSLA